MGEFIKCCPFCGSHKVNIVRTNEEACWVKCVACDAETDSDPSREKAIEKWNYRFYDDNPSLVIEDWDKDGGT